MRPVFESVAKPGGTCHVTGEPIEAGTRYIAALRETDEGLERMDVLPDAWPRVKDRAWVAYWQTTMPDRTAKARPLVDDAVLADLLDRLDGTDGEEKQRFRFVVALVLMRKRQLVYEGADRREDASQWWHLRWRGKDHAHREPITLLDPGLTEEQIAGLTDSVGQILNAEL